MSIFTTNNCGVIVNAINKSYGAGRQLASDGTTSALGATPGVLIIYDNSGT